jgi:tRNA G46 methylase TrmB
MLTHRLAYHFPNDRPENERMEQQYELLKLVMDGRLHFAPFSRTNPPRKVLDIATGTGTWAIEMGDRYPEAEIIGTDLSPIQPTFVPPNVRFFVEDSGDDW